MYEYATNCPEDDRGNVTAHRLGVATALVDGEWVAGDVVVDDGVVRDVGVTPAGKHGCAVPGFVDVQVNGFAGVSFTACDRAGFDRAAATIATHGVTSFLPTIPTARPDEYPAALELAARAVADPSPGARPLGVHLEGPFLSVTRRGAHQSEWLRAPDVSLASDLLSRAPVTVMTLAPELDGAAAVIDLLRSRGVVVAAGHTDATGEQAHLAFDDGVAMVTHLWNAQRPITSREPGLAGVALTRPGVFVGIIADLVHVCAETLALSLHALGERAVIVTDAAAAAGLPTGEHDTGGRTVVVRDRAVFLPDGTLTGAAVGLDACVRNAVRVGRSLAQAVHAVTAAPARAIGRDDIGQMRPGARADVVVLDDELAVRQVLVAGAAVAP